MRLSQNGDLGCVCECVSVCVVSDTMLEAGKRKEQESSFVI